MSFHISFISWSDRAPNIFCCRSPISCSSTKWTQVASVCRKHRQARRLQPQHKHTFNKYPSNGHFSSFSSCYSNPVHTISVVPLAPNQPLCSCHCPHQPALDKTVSVCFESCHSTPQTLHDSRPGHRGSGSTVAPHDSPNVYCGLWLAPPSPNHTPCSPPPNLSNTGNLCMWQTAWASARHKVLNKQWCFCLYNLGTLHRLKRNMWIFLGNKPVLEQFATIIPIMALQLWSCWYIFQRLRTVGCKQWVHKWQGAPWIVTGPP